MKKISIIVPVYNREKYIDRCIKSILNQSFRDFELILVDDGSTDNSIHICNKYSNINDNIIVIHKENGGVSSARNIGLEHAKGEYIMFIDSDDYIEENMLEVSYNHMFENKADLFICGAKINTYIKDKIRGIQNLKLCNCEYLINEFLEKEGIDYLPIYINSVWAKLYKSEIIKNNNLKFKEDIYMGEDSIFNLEYLNNINKIITWNDYLYNYCVRDNNDAITSSYHTDKKVPFFITSINSFKLNLINKCKCNEDFIKKFMRISFFDPISHRSNDINNYKLLISDEYINKNIDNVLANNLREQIYIFLYINKNPTLLFIYNKILNYFIKIKNILLKH